MPVKLCRAKFENNAAMIGAALIAADKLKREKVMRGLSALVVWFGVVLFSAAGLLLLFYTAALLLPIILAVFAVSLVVGWYRQARIKRRLRI